MSTSKKIHKRTKLTIEDKYHILQDIKKQLTNTEIASKYGCKPNTISEYRNAHERQRILDAYQQRGNDHSQKKCKVQQGKFLEIEQALKHWILRKEAESPNLRLSYELLREKVLEIRDAQYKRVQLECPEAYLLLKDLLQFKVSNKWITQFMRRNNMHYTKRHGEAGSADLVAAEEGKIQLINLMKDYELKNIYNAD